MSILGSGNCAGQAGSLLRGGEARLDITLLLQRQNSFAGRKARKREMVIMAGTHDDMFRASQATVLCPVIICGGNLTTLNALKYQ